MSSSTSSNVPALATSQINLDELSATLETLGYSGTVPVAATCLVQALVNDLLRTTESLKTTKAINDDLLKQQQIWKLGTEMFRCESKRALVESNNVHRRLLEDRDHFELQLNEMAIKLEELKMEKSQLNGQVDSLKEQLKSYQEQLLKARHTSPKKPFISVVRPKNMPDTHYDCKRCPKPTTAVGKSSVKEPCQEFHYLKERLDYYVQEIKERDFHIRRTLSLLDENGRSDRALYKECCFKIAQKLEKEVQDLHTQTSNISLKLAEEAAVERAINKEAAAEEREIVKEEAAEEREIDKEEAAEERKSNKENADEEREINEQAAEKTQEWIRVSKEEWEEMRKMTLEVEADSYSIIMHYDEELNALRQQVLELEKENRKYRKMIHHQSIGKVCVGHGWRCHALHNKVHQLRNQLKEICANAVQEVNVVEAIPPPDHDVEAMQDELKALRAICNQNRFQHMERVAIETENRYLKALIEGRAEASTELKKQIDKQKMEKGSQTSRDKETSTNTEPSCSGTPSDAMAVKMVIRGLQTELNSARAEATRFKEEFKASDDHSRKMSEYISRLAAENKELKSKYNGSDKKEGYWFESAKQLQTKLDLTCKERVMLDTNVSRLKGELAEQMKKNEELRILTARSTEALKNADQELAKLQKKLTSFDKLKETARDMKSSIYELERKLDECNNYKHNELEARQKIQCLENDADRYRERILELQDEVVICKAQNDQLLEQLTIQHRQVMEAHERKSSSEQEIENLTGLLQKYVSDVKKAQDRLEQKENERCELMEHFRNLSEEQTLLDSKNQSLTEETENFRQQIEELEAEIAQKCEIIELWENQEEENVARINKLQEELWNYERQAQKQAELVEKQKIVYQRLLESRSQPSRIPLPANIVDGISNATEYNDIQFQASMPNLVEARADEEAWKPHDVNHPVVLEYFNEKYRLCPTASQTSLCNPEFQHEQENGQDNEVENEQVDEQEHDQEEEEESTTPSPNYSPYYMRSQSEA